LNFGICISCLNITGVHGSLSPAGKSQKPNTKTKQIPKNSIPILKQKKLVIGNWILFVIWYLGFGIYFLDHKLSSIKTNIIP
jgi:hypothetical protein